MLHPRTKHRKLASSFSILEGGEFPKFALLLGGPKVNGEVQYSKHIFYQPYSEERLKLVFFSTIGTN